MHMRSSKKQGFRIRDWGFVLLALYVASGFSRTVGVSRALSAQQYTFEEVASGLKHQDPATRLRAIQILKDADYAEAAVPIAALLEDKDDRVQLAAIDAERSLFTTRVVPRRKKIGFIVEVRSVAGGDAAAAGQLALKPRVVPPQLLNGVAVALRDNSPRVRAEAIGLAALIGRMACPPPPRPGRVSPELGSIERTTADAAASACEHVGNALVDNINAREPLLRRTAMQALGQVRYVNAVQALADRFSYHQRGLDAMAALEGMAAIGHPTSASVFEELLTSSNADMRRYAVEGLARVGHRDALPTLQQMGQSERSSGVLLALHFAHVKLVPESVNSLQALVAALDNSAQRSLALNFLLDVAPSVAPALAQSLTHDSADVRRLVADVLGFSRDPQVAPMLAAATRDSDPDVAAAAGQAIERLQL